MSDPPMNPEVSETLEHFPSPKVAEILDKYLEDLQNGRACSREELLDRHPQFKDQLVEYIDGIAMVAGLGVGKDLVPKQLGDFEILGQIGQGAMGTVYRANQRSLKREVALKVLRYSASSDQTTKRFEREAELVATLRHSNIVPIFATGEDSGSHYLAMQLINGPSLSQWSFEEDCDRNQETIAKWGAQVARALAHAHQRDVIHRDVKPSNLLMEGDHIWLTDFGLARRYDDIRMSMTGAMLGTPNYMSPEQASPGRRPIDFRTDVYSLGATLFELLTGRCVFIADTPHAAIAQVLVEEPPVLSELVPGASRDLETILMKCLEKEPGDRYQDMESLAEDLEAFANGRSIKARRPNMVERFTRWRKQNQKAFAWASTTAAVALSAIALSIAVWFGWRDAISGTLNIESDEGPIIGRLIDSDGTASQSFSIPTESPMSVKAGHYTLQMWAGGRLGESQQLTVDRKAETSIHTQLGDNGVFPERTVEGYPAVLPLGDRDDMIFFTTQGVTRVDGRNGRTVWTANASDFSSKATRQRDEDWAPAFKNKDGSSTRTWRPLQWADKLSQRLDYGDRFVPQVGKEIVDFNADGQRDVLVHCQGKPELYAFNGTDGALLWSYRPLPPLPENGQRYFQDRGTDVHAPVPVGDVDGDGVPDIMGVFLERSFGLVDRWIDVVSGKTGQKIWRFEMSPEWFDSFSTPATAKAGRIPPKPKPDLAMVIGSYGMSVRHNFLVGTKWRCRSGNSYRGSSNGDLKPWPMVLADLSDPSGEAFFSAGDRLFSIDLKTGKPGSFNGGKPMQQNFVAALPPKAIRSADGKCIGILMCEALKLAKPGQGQAPATRFCLVSPETGKELWSYVSDCDPGWLMRIPSWPMIADLNGDDSPEILICEGTDLGVASYKFPTCQSSLQALDWKTGKPLWDKIQRAKIRSLNRQIQHVLLGPDADGDQKDDVYVISPMKDQQKSWVFVDILKGSSGERIRTVSSDVPFFGGNNFGLEFETPFFFSHPADPEQRIVIATKSGRHRAQRQSTIVMSLKTGKLLQTGNQLEHPMLLDGDGDGHKDLFLIKPRFSDRVDRSGQLVSHKAVASTGYVRFGAGHARIDDVDGDGIRDLFANGSESTFGGACRSLSGATGETIFDWEFKPNGHEIFPLNEDIDGDNIHDFVASRRDFGRGMSFFYATIELISGRKGALIWQQELPSENQPCHPSFKCADVDGDGKRDLLVAMATMLPGSTVPVKPHMVCFDGASGQSKWIAPISDDRSPFYPEKSILDFKLVDINGDSFFDIIAPYFDNMGGVAPIALDGQTGKKIWQGKATAVSGQFRKKPGRSVIIPKSANCESLLVEAEEAELAVAPSETTLHFRKLSDGTSLFKKVTIPAGESGISESATKAGVPFHVADGDKSFVGIGLFESGSGSISVFVLDPGNKGEVAQKITAKEFATGEVGFGSNRRLLVTDIGDDGRTDGLFYVNDEIVAVELASKGLLNRKKIQGLSRFIKSDSGFVEIVTERDEDKRVKLLDPQSLDVKWDLNYPGLTEYVGLLNSEFPVEPAKATLPVSMFTVKGKSNAVNCQIATAASFSGEASMLDIPPPIPQTMDSDIRLQAPLPWNRSMGGQSLKSHVFSVVTEEIPVALGAIVFPAFLLFTVFRRKRWNLRTFLMLPLLFAIPWAFLQFPHTLGTSIAVQNGIPEWAGKIFASMLGIPGLVFIGVVIAHIWHFRWKKLTYLLLAVFAITTTVAVLSLLAAIRELPPGGYYDWWNPNSLLLLTTSSWFVGFGIAGGKILRLVINFFRSLAGNPPLGEPELA